MDKKNFKCTVAYKGTVYYGWQKQKNFLTIQGIIEYALGKIFAKEISTYAASRTDAGVHAFGQVFNFKTETSLEPENIKNILNDLLPEDVVIKNIEEADSSFNPRQNVKKKFYRYLIFNANFLHPVYKGLCWQVIKPIKIDEIMKILPAFLGIKNYFSFSKSGSDDKQFERTIDKIRVKRKNKWVYFDFEGQSFLYQMLRKITAVLVMFAHGKVSRETIEEMFKKEDRTISGHIAPPDGLYLMKITYDKNRRTKISAAYDR